jgi:hypothetical protein
MADTNFNTSLSSFTLSKDVDTTATVKTPADIAKEQYQTKLAAYNFVNAEDLLNQIKSGASTSDPTAQGGKTSVLTNGSVPGTATTTGNLNYTTGNYITDFQGADGNLADLGYIQNPKTKEMVVVRNSDKSQVVLMGDPTDASKYIVTDYTTAINRILDPYRKSNKLSQLKQTLINRGFLTAAQAAKSVGEDKTFMKGLIASIDDMTRTNFTTGKDSKIFRDYVANLTGFSATPITTTSTLVNLTDKKIAAADITAYINQTLGRPATPDEVSDYVSSLNKFEIANPSKATVTAVGGAEKRRVQTAGASDQDKQAIKVAVLSKALTAQGIDPTSISKTGGAIAQNMDILKQTAAKYGMAMDDRMALDHVVETLKPGGDIKQRTELIKQNSKLMYKNLASYIDQGGTIKDVADNYNYYKKKYLETAGETDVFDKDIQKALHNDGKAGVMNLNDFIVSLKQKPEWAKTMNAHEEAANYANTVLKSFGLVG